RSSRRCRRKLCPPSQGHAVLPPAAASAALALQHLLHGPCALMLGRLCRDRRDQPGGRHRPAASDGAVLEALLQAAWSGVFRDGRIAVMLYLDPTARAIVNGLQGEFPLTSRPFRDAGRKLGLTEDELIEGVRDLTEAGALSRFGPLWNAEAIGGGACLAAMA